MKKISVLFVLFVLFLVGFGAETVSAQKRNKKKAVASFKGDWIGKWSVPSRFYGSTLTVKRVMSGKFLFELQAYNGANEGAISGVAVLKGAKAYFDDRNQAGDKSEKQGCRLVFTHRGKFIDIRQNEKCDYYAGNAVSFTDKYYKNVMVVKEADFVVLEVFPNKNIDWKFKQLVGNDYEKFLDAFHLISEQENLDAFGAKVISACVRGNCPWNTGIIMYDQKGDFWAALIKADEDESETASVRYYTNAAGWENKTPKTIDNWITEKREFNEGLKIIYKNGK